MLRRLLILVALPAIVVWLPKDALIEDASEGRLEDDMEDWILWWIVGDADVIER